MLLHVQHSCSSHAQQEVGAVHNVLAVRLQHLDFSSLAAEQIPDNAAFIVLDMYAKLDFGKP